MSELFNTVESIYPWQQTSWEQLQKRHAANNIPHALMLIGPQGNGKYQFARSFAKFLLCNDSTGTNTYCNQCQSCHWFDNNTHPDLNEILPTGKANIIKVDQIRELCQQLALTSHSGGYQIALIYPAENMNLNAANSLLKSLEEPNGNTLYILVSHEPGQLPATVRSRCQMVKMPTPAPDFAQQWIEQQGINVNFPLQNLLAIAGGAPLNALKLLNEQQLEKRVQLAQELVAVIDDQSCLVPTAEKWAKQNIHQINLWLLSWVNDMIKERFCPDHCYQQNPDVQNVLQTLNNKLKLTLLFRVHDQLMQANQAIKTANQQMLAESILLSWIS